MERKFESLSLFEFQEMFPDEDACFAYLADMKWKSGFVCTICKNKVSCKAVRPHDRQCTRCNHIESPTAGTLFHRLRFSLLKAFYIIYYVATTKKGIASTELSRKLGMRQKTAWLFKQKVMRAMASSHNYLLEGQVDVDETYVGGQDDRALGRNEGKKRIVVVAIEKKGRGVSRMYGKVIKTASKENLKKFMQANIGKDAQVRTDGWLGYRGLEKEFPKIKKAKSEKKGKNFGQMHRTIMMFKAWLRGMHHSVNNLQAYIDEYTYRFNRQHMGKGIFENLLGRMMTASPYTYKMIRNDYYSEA